MRQKALCLCAAIALLGACSKNVPAGLSGGYDQYSVRHGEIILGNKLENPYSTENVKSAFAALYPTKSVSDIRTTDYYVRFLPETPDQLDMLKEMGLSLIDHPVDYTVLQEGDYYRDPSLSADAITWQYAVVDKDFVFPEHIRYELLQECYLAEHDTPSKALDGVNWDAVEAEAFRLTGNESLLSEAGTRGQKEVKPSGRIMIVDDKAAGATPAGLSGVKIQCNVFVKFASTYTDREGYYTMPKSFSAKPRYRLIFKNEKGFSIGFNSIFYPASVSTLGKASNEGITTVITKNSDRALFRRSAVSNACYEYYETCSDSALGLTPPPSDLCIWTFDIIDASSAVMLHHGTVLDKESKNLYFRLASMVVAFFGPDVTIGSKYCEDYQSIFDLTVHELAHATHFQRVGKAWWDRYIAYIVKCFIKGESLYGHNQLEDSGICATGEMWAYYLGSLMHMSRYGGSNPNFGSGEWFHPQIFTYLDERGISSRMILAALKPSVVDMDTLRDELCSLYPDRKRIIDQAFNRYGL